MRSRTLAAAVLGVVGLLLTAMVVTHPASAAGLTVSSAPLQTWRLENAAPVLPGITPASSAESSRRQAAKPATSQSQDDGPAAPTHAETTPEDAASPLDPDDPDTDSDTDPETEPDAAPVAAPSESSDPSGTSGPATDQADGTASSQTDLEVCGDLSQYDEVVYGTAGDDTLVAGAGKQVLVGLGGDDVLDGGDGDDCLVGGAGDDDLIGQAEDDDLDGGPGADATAPTDDGVPVPLEDLVPGSE